VSIRKMVISNPLMRQRYCISEASRQWNGRSPVSKAEDTLFTRQKAGISLRVEVRLMNEAETTDRGGPEACNPRFPGL